jgi:hypothetical protein
VSGGDGVKDPLQATRERLRGELTRRAEPRGRNHYVLVVLDSCRFDTWMAAKPKVLGRLGTVERRYSYASWTPPAHYNLLTGLLPHPSPRGVFASDYYKGDYLHFNRRLATDHVAFEKLLPALYLPTFFRRELGYYTHARVSIPVINPATPLNRDFDSYRLMERHNDFAALLGTLAFSAERPSFHLLNLGETHFPYATAEEDPKDWPKVHGEGGVLRALESGTVGLLRERDAPAEFDAAVLERLRRRQVRAVQQLDPLFEQLFDRVPKNTFVTVTSDHGELFGEDGYFGHGPIFHEKVFEVPFVEGQVR